MGVALTLAANIMSFSFHAYQQELFPTGIRARAAGFVYSWSRLSVIFSSFIIAFMLSASGAFGVFVFIAAAMGVVMATIGVFGPRTTNLALEEIARCRAAPVIRGRSASRSMPRRPRPLDCFASRRKDARARGVLSPRPPPLFRRHPGGLVARHEVEAIEVHHLGPGLREVLDELLLRVGARIDLRKRPETASASRR